MMKHTPQLTWKPEDFVLDPYVSCISSDEAYLRAATALRERRMGVRVPSLEEFLEMWKNRRRRTPPPDPSGFLDLVLALMKSTRYPTYGLMRVVVSIRTNEGMHTYQVTVVEGEIFAVRERT